MEETKNLIETARTLSKRQCQTRWHAIHGKRYWQIPWLEAEGLHHVFSSVDQNLKLAGRIQDPALLTEWQFLLDQMPCNRTAYYFMGQVHSACVDSVETENMGVPYGLGNKISREEGPDGLMTSRRDFLLSSSFGDCAPLLFWDPVRKVQANVHSGWRGTLHNIAQSTVSGLKEVYDTNPEDLRVAIGPHIGPEDFEVSQDVATLFQEAFPEQLFLVKPHPNHPEKWLVDLTCCLHYELMKAGVRPENIQSVGLSTVSHPDCFHSYRRDKENFGLMMVLSQIAGS